LTSDDKNFIDLPENQPTDIIFECTILHLGLHVLLRGEHKIGWTTRSEYALVTSAKTITEICGRQSFQGSPGTEFLVTESGIKVSMKLKNLSAFGCLT